MNLTALSFSTSIAPQITGEVALSFGTSTAPQITGEVF